MGCVFSCLAIKRLHLCHTSTHISRKYQPNRVRRNTRCSDALGHPTTATWSTICVLSKLMLSPDELEPSGGPHQCDIYHVLSANLSGRHSLRRSTEEKFLRICDNHKIPRASSRPHHQVVNVAPRCLRHVEVKREVAIRVCNSSLTVDTTAQVLL